MKTLYALLIITLSSPLFSQIQGKGGLPTSTKLVLNDKVIEQWIEVIVGETAHLTPESTHFKFSLIVHLSDQHAGPTSA